MGTIADTAVRGAAGIFVVAAVLLIIWVARDSSARSGAPNAASESESGALYSARRDRASVARTAISSQRQKALEPHPSTKVAQE